jgi:hypothetical protein
LTGFRKSIPHPVNPVQKVLVLGSFAVNAFLLVAARRAGKSVVHSVFMKHEDPPESALRGGQPDFLLARADLPAGHLGA